MAACDGKLLLVKRYMRVDGDEDDLIISSLYAAAAIYLKNAGIEEPEGGSALYNLAVWSLTFHYYNHRDSVGSEASFPTGLRPIINQLKMPGTTSASGIFAIDEKLLLVKQYMRVDGDEDDLIISALYAAAAIYLKNAGIEEPEGGSSQYDLAVWSLTLHYYDHRDAVSTEASFPIGLRPIINQLKQDGEILRSIST